MKRNHYIISLLIAVVFSGLSFTMLPDSVFLPYLLKRFNEYQLQNSEEKLYAHTDKPFYKPGDKIWIAVYLRNGQSMKASTQSNIVYAELIDPRGGVYQKINIKAIDGKAGGFFLIDSMAPGGIYKVKAYTAWMKNSPGFIAFEKEIQVQKIIQPRLLWKLDFAKQAYGPGDTVVAHVSLKDLSNNPIIHKQLRFQVLIEGKEQQSSDITTNSTGNFQITFKLPDVLLVNDGLLNLTINHNGRKHALSRSIPIVLNKIDLQFMPEGGDYIENIKSKIAFKALNEFGKPADIEGYITNSSGKKVAFFKSFHQGMGAFHLTSVANERYTAHITIPAGISSIYNLPASIPSGIVLSVDTCTENSLNFRMDGNVTKLVHCIIHIRGVVMHSKSYYFNNQSITESIQTTNWPAGIAHMTLFDDFENPVAERLVFVNAHKKMQFTISTDKNVYYPRQKVRMKIQTTDENGRPVPANLSVGVVNDKIVSFANDKQDNILTSLLLTSDLTGKVHEPSFYFKDDEPKALPAIDYLLLTQGWRRFSWKTVLKGHERYDFPETYNQIRGQVFNNQNKSGIKAKVSLINTNQKKSATVKTTSSGKFEFSYLDSLSTFTIYAKSLNRKNKHISIRTGNLNFTTTSFGRNLSIETASFNIQAKGITEEGVNASIELEKQTNEQTSSDGGAPFILFDDTLSLDEVVTIGYGVQRKSSLTASVVSVQSDELFTASDNFTSILAGNIAGVSIINNQSSPGSVPAMRIRGTASSFISEPLYIVDGIPVQNIGSINPSNINHIEVLKDPAVMSIYGTRAANGVVIINTINNQTNYFSPRRVNRRVFSTNNIQYNRPFLQPCVEFYKPMYQDKDSAVTEPDYRETIFWQPTLKTNKDGIAMLEFCNSDEVTTFRAIVEGIDNNGLIGRGENTHSIEKPLSIDAILPPYLVFGDKISIPVVITNTTSQPITGRLHTKLPHMLHTNWPSDSNFTVQAGGLLKINIPATVSYTEAKDKIDLRFGNDGYTDRFVETVEVLKRGFPANFSFSSRALKTSFSLPVSDVIENSLSGKLFIYNNLLDQVMAGIESVLREPHGCFEQLAATTYPNIQVLNYLRTNQQYNPESDKKARDLIQIGYKKLTAYETKQHGFEWFGGTPAHEGLTAYGLMLFTDMAEVTNIVDPKLIDRTIQYLLNRRNGKGGFNQNNGKYGFSGASPKVTNAYVVMALSHARVYASQYGHEFNTALAEALKSEDSYRMSLMAHACINVGDSINAKKLLDKLAWRVSKHGIKSLKPEQTIVNSYGVSKNIETASLLADALIRSNHQDFVTINTLMDFILGNRTNGGFGSTQATVLALKAILSYGMLINQITEPCSVTLMLNNKKIVTREITAGSKSVVIDSLQNYIQPGLLNWEVSFNGNRNPISFAMDLNWSINMPVVSDPSNVSLETTLMETDCKVGDLVRMKVRIKNKTSIGLPMSLAMIGIPSGLTLQPWQLKEMQEKLLFDYYEIHKNYLVLYYREMGPNETISLNLDLKAEVAGKFEAPASNAYLYYTNELRDWEKGHTIEITEK